MTKPELIEQIKANLPVIGIALDCSRYENTYDGYGDSRDWFVKYCDKEITIDEYLNGISLQKLTEIAKNI